MAENQQNCGGDDPSLVKIGEIVKEIDDGCGEVELVEIEIFARENRKPPQAKKYKIRIDREPRIVEKRKITGEELLALVDKKPLGWRLYQKRHGGQMEEIQSGQVVDLGECGIERFTTIERAQGDGEQATAEASPPVRREFRLPEEDETYLNAVGLRWEAIVDGKLRWVLIYEHPMPEGYNLAVATLAIRIEKGYPPAKLDMCYIHPPLARADGKAIHKLTTQQIEGVAFQRWSRHYEWREGDDFFGSHHLRVKNWLAAELER